MWADTLFNLERGHLLRLALWAAASVLAGGLLFVVFRRNARVPFLRHFAIQFVIWGLADAAFAAAGWRSLALRDYASAMKLRDFLWLNVGLDIGYVAIGVTLAAATWMAGKRLGGVGAGTGIVVQGFALLFLDLRLLTLIDAARIAQSATSATFWVPT